MTKEPNLERISKFLIAIFILTIFSNYFFASELTSILTKKEMGQYSARLQLISIVQMVMMWLINIVLAVWVYKKADSNKWSWAFLAIVFGINAVILIYLSKILNTSKTD